MNDFIKKQIVACKEATDGFLYSRMFMPESGVCWGCHKNIIDKETEKGNDGSKMVTGCPHCYRSYVD